MKFFNFLLLSAIILSSCKITEEETATSETNEVNEKVSAVCVSNGVAVRAEPHKKGKYISSLSLGESLLYIGESAIDSNDNDRTYYQVELSDGTVSWVRSYGVLINAEPAAIVVETPIYKRPDLVTKTDKSFYSVEFVAIVGEKNGWLEVVGAGKTKKGWIKKDAVTTQQEDVATSTLAYKDLLKDGKIVSENISVFLDELPYENTQFVSYLQGILDAQVENAIVDAIEEYEEVESEIFN